MLQKFFAQPVAVPWALFYVVAAGLKFSEATENLPSSKIKPDSLYLQRKVRVNILYITRLSDAPMLYRDTYAELSGRTKPTNASNANDIYPNSLPWPGNDQLKNVEVYIAHRDTQYNVNFNLQVTMSTMLQLFIGQSSASSCSCEPAGNKSASNSEVTPAIHMIVGPSFSSEAKAISQLSSFYQLTMIAGAVSSPALADRSRYPYFFRTCPSDSEGPDVVINLLKHFMYNQINAIYLDEAFMTDVSGRWAVARILRKILDQIEHKPSFVSSYAFAQFRERLEPVLRARGITLENPLVYNVHNNRSYFNLANVLGFTARSHVYVLPFTTSQYELFCALYKFGAVHGSTHLPILYGHAFDGDWLWSPATATRASGYLYVDECTNEQLHEVLRGALLVAPGDADYADRPSDIFGLRPSEFAADMKRASPQKNSFYSWLYFKFDALAAAALALDRAERDLQDKFNTSLAYFRYNDTRVVKNIYGQLSNLSFQGLTGPLSFSSTGDRINSGWIIRQFQGKEFVDVGRYSGKNATSFNLTFHQPLLFATDDGQPPPQFGLVSSWATPLNISLLTIGAALFVLLIMLGSVYTRYRIKQSALRSVLGHVDKWFIDQSALTANERTLSRSVVSASHTSLASRKISHASGVLDHTSNVDSVPNTFLSYKYEGERVCLFALQQPRLQPQQRGGGPNGAVVVDREFASHLLLAQSCSNYDSLSRFVGVARMMLSEPPDLMYLVMSGTSKGTLCQFLNQADAGLDETCSFSFLKDLQKGLAEVHKRIGYHGRLSSTVCMIDNRLSLRVNDYGFSPYRQENFFSSGSSNYENWLWTAPELLKTLDIKVETSSNETGIVTSGISKADLYSFGIISAEIFTHSSPPFEEHLGPVAVPQLLARMVHEPDTAQSLLRDTLTTQECAKDIVDFVLVCLNGNAAHRPTLTEIGVALHNMMKTRKLSDNLTDMLMKRLETYATDLASLVEQRTAALVEEENKVRRLLYQILPPSVADALKNGQSVPPQTYDSVTIYFSDIVGFTTISASSTPLEIVDFLNDLYITFDSIISKFDVYKVETIGDAYMVVSGLPHPNELEHARYIVRMSLALVWHVTHGFRIRHRPNEQLFLRIGLHSGPCAAGVVGFVMPRYCLFGDTVNTASRMESNGEALRIHASEVTVNILRKLDARDGSVPEFNLELRGEIAVKGKGIMQTYWITKAT